MPDIPMKPVPKSENISFETRAYRTLINLPQGSELVSDLQLAILRLLNAGADRDAVKIFALRTADTFRPISE